MSDNNESTSLHVGEGFESVRANFLIENRFHVTIHIFTTHYQSSSLQATLTGERQRKQPNSD